MLELDDITLDPTKTENGVWCEYMGGQFLIGRKNAAYHARLSELYQERKDLISKEGPEGMQALTYCYQRAFCEHVLKDWKGIKKAGKELKYSPDIAMQIVTDPRLSEMAQHLEMFSLQHSNFKEDAVNQVAKSVKRTAAS